MGSHPPLDALRLEIDRLDLELLQVLSRRREVVGRVAAYKHEHHLPGVDLMRESAMRAAMVQQGAALNVPATLVNAVLDAVLEDSRGEVSFQDDHHS